MQVCIRVTTGLRHQIGLQRHQPVQGGVFGSVGPATRPGSGWGSMLRCLPETIFIRTTLKPSRRESSDQRGVTSCYSQRSYLTLQISGGHESLRNRSREWGACQVIHFEGWERRWLWYWQRGYGQIFLLVPRKLWHRRVSSISATPTTTRPDSHSTCRQSS